MEKKSNKKNIIIIIIFAIVMIGIIIGMLILFPIGKKISFKKEYPIEKVTITNKDISLYKDDILKLEYEYTPQEATNANFIWSSSDENIVKIENGTITAISKGNATICVSLDNNESIKDCKDITVKLKVDDFIEQLVNTYRYTQTDEYIFKSCMSENCEIYEEIDLGNETYTVVSGTLTYIYNYALGTVEGSSEDGEYKVQYMYIISTNSFACYGEPVIFHQHACSASSQQIALNTINTVIYSFNSLTENYTIKDLKIY